MEKFLEQFDVDIDEPEVDKHELFDSLLRYVKKDSKNVELYWRLVQAALVLASSYEKVGDKSNGKQYVEEAVKYAKKAVEYGPKSLQAHKWYCAAVGRLTPYVSTKEKIQLGHEFKKHRDQAVKIDPNDRLMHHMYGRWCLEVASLTWLERKVASTFFGTPPEATYEDALASFQMADSLKSDWKSNHCYMAKTYVAMGKYRQAMEWVDSGLALPVQTEEDGLMEVQLKELESSYSKYRH